MGILKDVVFKAFLLLKGFRLQVCLSLNSIALVCHSSSI